MWQRGQTQAYLLGRSKKRIGPRSKAYTFCQLPTCSRNVVGSWNWRPVPPANPGQASLPVFFVNKSNSGISIKSILKTRPKDGQQTWALDSPPCPGRGTKSCQGWGPGMGRWQRDRPKSSLGLTLPPDPKLTLGTCLQHPDEMLWAAEKSCQFRLPAPGQASLPIFSATFLCEDVQFRSHNQKYSETRPKAGQETWGSACLPSPWKGFKFLSRQSWWDCQGDVTGVRSKPNSLGAQKSCTDLPLAPDPKPIFGASLRLAIEMLWAAENGSQWVPPAGPCKVSLPIFTVKDVIFRSHKHTLALLQKYFETRPTAGLEACQWGSAWSGLPGQGKISKFLSTWRHWDANVTEGTDKSLSLGAHEKRLWPPLGQDQKPTFCANLWPRSAVDMLWAVENGSLSGLLVPGQAFSQWRRPIQVSQTEVFWN